MTACGGLASCSSGSSAPKSSRTTVLNGAVGDATTPEWLHVLDFVDHGGARMPTSTIHGSGSNGSGATDRVDLARTLRGRPALLRITMWTAGPFVVDELDARGRPSLVTSSVGPYDGEAVIDTDGTTVALTIRAPGKWALHVGDLRSATSFTRVIHGKGDEVLVYRGSEPTLSTSFRGNSDFTAMYYGRAGTEDLTGDEFGNYSGQAPVGPGAAVVVVVSAGTWTITPTA